MSLRQRLARLRTISWMDVVALVALPLVRDSSGDSYHANFRAFVEQVNALPDGAKVLELGSRESQERGRFAGQVSYTGLDIHAGPCVDVVGDAHELSRLFPPASYDAVFCISTFEHLAMPWKAALEIGRILKPDGTVFIATHPVWPLHMEPWDFFRFSPYVFHALFGPSLGFEVLRADAGLPCRILPLNTERSARRLYLLPSYLGVTMLARKTGEARADLSWDIDVPSELRTMYPAAPPSAQ